MLLHVHVIYGGYNRRVGELVCDYSLFKYLLSGPFQKKFADFWFSWLESKTQVLWPHATYHTYGDLASFTFLTPSPRFQPDLPPCSSSSAQWGSGGPRTFALAVPSPCHALSSDISWLTHFLQTISQSSSSLSVLLWLSHLIFSLNSSLDLYLRSCFFFFSSLALTTIEHMMRHLSCWESPHRNWRRADFSLLLILAIPPGPEWCSKICAGEWLQSSGVTLRSCRTLLTCLLTLNAT